MGRISAGVEFGQAVAEPLRTAGGSDPSAGAMALADSANRLGAEQVNEAQTALGQEANAREHLQAQAAADRMRLDRERLAEQERMAGARAQARMLNLRDGLADTLSSIDADVQEGRLSKDDAASAWKDRSTTLIADGLADVPESHRQFVQIDAEGLSMRLASKVGDIVRKRERTDTLAAVQQTLEYTERLAVTDPDRARAIMQASVRGAGPAAGLTPDKLSAIEQGWVEKTSYTRAFSSIHAARYDNKALTAVEQAIAGNQDLDTQKRATLLAEAARWRADNEARALRAAQRAELAAQKRQRESSAAYNVLSGWALAGKVPSGDDPANAALIAKLTPEDAAAYRMLAADVPARAAAAMLPLDTQAAQLDQFYAMRAQQGTSQRLETEIKRREQVLAEARKDYTADPLRAAQERGLLDQPLQPLRTDSLDALAAGIGQRISQAQSAETRTGRPVSPLLAREATAFGSLIKKLPIEQQAERLSQISSLMPAGMAQALAQQIAHGHTEQDKAVSIALALGSARTTEGRPVSQLVLKGAQALRDKAIKEEKTPVDGWMGQITKQLAGVYVNPQQADMAAQAARLVLAGLVSDGAGGSADDAKRAVRLAVGGAIREHNGERLLVPAGLEVSDIEKRLKSVRAEDIGLRDLGLPNGMVYIGGQVISSDEFIASLPEARLQYAGRGRYYVRAGTSYASRADGEPIVVKVAPSAR